MEDYVRTAQQHLKRRGVIAYAEAPAQVGSAVSDLEKPKRTDIRSILIMGQTGPSSAELW
jgi:hypothetical protein